MDITGLFFCLFYFGLYLIPAFPVHIFFIVQSKRPCPILSACINFVVWSVLLVLWTTYGIRTHYTIIAFAILELAILVTLPLVMIILDFSSPLIYRHIIHWKSKQTHAGIISGLAALCIYIGLGFFVFYHLM